MKKSYKGFTLIELLIVIAIIGILASIVLVSLSNARNKAKVAAYKAQVHAAQSKAVIDCDGGAITVANLVPATGSYMNTPSLGANSCGTSGAGTFTMNVTAVNTSVPACDSNVATVNETGASFYNGC